MPIAADLQGQRFSKLLVLHRAPSDNPAHKWHVAWLCRCDCGGEIITTTKLLKNRAVKSCGCLRHQPAHNRTHGMSETREFNVWMDARKRCHNPRSAHFRDYGGRGIQMCERWRGSFQNFFADMGLCPDPSYSLERRDNSKGYAPENCVWASRLEQNNNKRNVDFIEWRGERRTRSQWARHLGMKPHTLGERIRGGWPIEKAFTTPVHQSS